MATHMLVHNSAGDVAGVVAQCAHRRFGDCPFCRDTGRVPHPFLTTARSAPASPPVGTERGLVADGGRSVAPAPTSARAASPLTEEALCE